MTKIYAKKKIAEVHEKRWENTSIQTIKILIMLYSNIKFTLNFLYVRVQSENTFAHLHIYIHTYAHIGYKCKVKTFNKQLLLNFM